MSKPFLTLDVGSSTIKVAEFALAKDGNLQLVRYAAAPIGLDPHDEESRPAQITTTIRELLANTGIAPGKVLMTVSGQQVFTRYVPLPRVDEKKIDQIVEFEVKQNVPIPMDQVVWDYQVLPTAGDDMNILLVAIKKDLLDSLVASVTDAGLQPELIDVAPLAICNAVYHNYPGFDDCALVVDMGARATNLIFIESGRVYNRSIPVAGNTITQQMMKDFELDYAQAEELKQQNAQVSFGGAYESLPDETQDKVARCVRSIMTRMHAEISRSINFYRGQQGGSQPTRIFLTGGTSLIPYADAFLKEKLGIEVEYFNPFAQVSVAPDISEEDISRDAHLLAELVGLATRRTGKARMEVDLMPQEVLEERAARRKQPVYLVALGVLVAASGLWLVSALRAKAEVARQLETVSAQVSELQGHEQQIKARQREGAAVRAQVDEFFALKRARGAWVRALDAIRLNFPAGAWISSLTLAETMVEPPAEGKARKGDEPRPPVPLHQLQIQGLIYEDAFSANSSVIQAYVDQLRQNPLFSDKTNLKTAPVRMPTRDYVRMFWVEAELKEPLPR